MTQKYEFKIGSQRVSWKLKLSQHVMKNPLDLVHLRYNDVTYNFHCSFRWVGNKKFRFNLRFAIMLSTTVQLTITHKLNISMNS